MGCLQRGWISDYFLMDVLTSFSLCGKPILYILSRSIVRFSRLRGLFPSAIFGIRALWPAAYSLSLLGRFLIVSHAVSTLSLRLFQSVLSLLIHPTLTDQVNTSGERFATSWMGCFPPVGPRHSYWLLYIRHIRHTTAHFLPVQLTTP
jgi:hypothetical protein